MARDDTSYGRDSGYGGDRYGGNSHPSALILLQRAHLRSR